VNYLTLPEVLAVNERVMALDGQQSLLRDQGSLDGALKRPQMAAYYEQANLPRQVALLVSGIALAHAFVDGNKRTALLAGTMFLDVNGYTLDTQPLEFAKQILAFLNRSDSLEAATDWLEMWMQQRLRLQP